MLAVRASIFLHMQVVFSCILLFFFLYKKNQHSSSNLIKFLNSSHCLDFVQMEDDLSFYINLQFHIKKKSLPKKSNHFRFIFLCNTSNFKDHLEDWIKAINTIGTISESYLLRADSDGFFQNMPDHTFIQWWSGQGARVCPIVSACRQQSSRVKVCERSLFPLQ